MTNVVIPIFIQNIQPVVCKCKRQLCKGHFIPSRINQKTCLFDLKDRGLLDKYPPIKDKRYSTQELILFIVDFREATNTSVVRLYDYFDDASFDESSFEEMDW